MKHIKLMAAFAVMALLLASCGKNDYRSFVGTWGVEKIEYYNIDYAGNPIAATLQTFTYDPEVINDGIQLVFRENKTGEMRDNNVDTIPTDWNEETQVYDSYIVNPDTTLLSTFTYSYDKDEAILYMTMNSNQHTFKMSILNMSDDAFVYENEYSSNYMEKAYLKRLSNVSSKAAAGKSNTKRPHKEGSFISGR